MGLVVVLALSVLAWGVGTRLGSGSGDDSSAGERGTGGTAPDSGGSGSDSGPGGANPTRLAAARSYAAGPSANWTVSPSDFLNGRQGGQFYSVAPPGVDFERGTGAVGVVTAGSIVVGLGVGDQEDSDQVNDIIGIDPVSGSLQWRFGATDAPVECAGLPTQHSVACVNGTMHLIDTDSDGQRGFDEPDGAGSGLTTIVDGPGDRFYQLDYEPSGDGISGFTLIAWTSEGEQWSATQDVDPRALFRGNLVSEATDDSISLDFEGNQYLLSTADGSLIKRHHSSEGAQDNPFGLNDPTVSAPFASTPQYSTRNDVTVEASVAAGALTATDGSGNRLWSRPLPDLDAQAAELGPDAYGETAAGAVATGFTDPGVAMTSRVLVEGWTGFGSGSTGEPQDVTRYRTPCGREPQVDPVAARSADGDLQVTLVFHAVCPGGQWVDGKAVDLRLTDALQDTFGHGVYDFSQTPMWLPGPTSGARTGRGVTTTVSLPPGSAYATAEEVSSRVTTIVVPCQHSAGSDGDDDEPARPEDVSDVLYAPYSAATDDDPRRNADALAALRRIAAQDADDVVGRLEGSWVPQLSSKKDGTYDVVDRHSYGYADILAEHLRLRGEDPDVRLLNSSSWKSFLQPGFWVSVVARPTSTADPALGFCNDEGYPVSHCLAKRILRDGPQAGSTRTRD